MCRITKYVGCIEVYIRKANPREKQFDGAADASIVAAICVEIGIGSDEGPGVIVIGQEANPPTIAYVQSACVEN